MNSNILNQTSHQDDKKCIHKIPMIGKKELAIFSFVLLKFFISEVPQ